MGHDPVALSQSSRKYSPLRMFQFQSEIYNARRKKGTFEVFAGIKLDCTSISLCCLREKSVDTIDDVAEPSRKHAYIFYPLNPRFYIISKTGVYRAIYYFSYFCSKT